MNKPPTKADGEATAGRDNEPAASAREQRVANRETWVRARENVTGEQEILVHDRESAVALREEALRARAEAEAARVEREHLLVQMREANERLIMSSLRADELAEHAIAARTAATETAAAEAEGRRRAEELTAQLRANEAALRASENTARESSRAKDDFVAMLGHELRNPLAPILIALDLIAMEGSDSHEREHAIIERQVHHLVHLVDDLLDTSRIRTGKVALKCEPIEMAEVVSRAVEMAGPMINSHDHVLSVEVPRRGLAVNGDAVRLAQVVGNLLTNAAKFTPSGGAIVVTGERRETTVALRVRDTGIGISKQMLPRLFDPYAQEHPEPNRVPTGLGLGLAIVRSLVEMHGGTVTAHSEGLGLGSEFVVELPALTRMSEAGPNGRASLVEAELPHRILVVDDNRDAASLTADALARLGHDVRVALDGHSALAMVQEFAPDIVLLDLGLPGMDGYEVARRLRAEFSHHVEIIAVTGYGQPLDRQRSKEARFESHLVKPVDIATLQRSIDASWKRWH
jgi:signal transduction histidine kinase